MKSFWKSCVFSCVLLAACEKPGATAAPAQVDATEETDAAVAETAPETTDAQTDAEILTDDTAADAAETADAATAETASDAAEEVDADAAEAKADGEVAANCPGGPHCPCVQASDCDNGICLEDRNGSYCAAFCTGESSCTSDEACIQTTQGADVISLCAPRFASLCAPCSVSADCQKGVIAGTPKCSSFGDIGSFCTASCSASSPCPSGFDCKAGACVPTDSVCSCSWWSVQHSSSTACKISNSSGSCAASLGCSSVGPLPVCLAATPTVESCNGVDDECDGLTDNVSKSVCDDGSSCTDDSCQAGSCQHAKNYDCGDGICASACGETGQTCGPDCHVCGNGVCEISETEENCGKDCTIQPVDCTSTTCEDGSVCTTDSCVPGKGCVHLATDATCSDGNACTADDACVNGGCIGGSSVLCDDGNPCTQDLCDVGLGCGATNADGIGCTDGDACTLGDVCAGGGCVPGFAPDCDDINPCTDDSCGGGKCVHSPNAATCTDSNACTDGEHCTGGSCSGANSIVCDDGNGCTSDSCAIASGCTSTLSDGIGCSDGDGCTLGDSCSGGTCVSGSAPDCNDSNVCTDDSCGGGKCVHLPGNSTCSDGNLCTTQDQCSGGSCTGSGSVVCDDGNGCTTDSCDSKLGCTTKNADAIGCSDGDGCTLGDSCIGGTCVSGSAPDCNDSNVCTDDSCGGGKCVHLPGSGTCSDGNLCTTLDQCSGGSCTGSGSVVCDDGNGCTTDSCDSKLGCTTKNADGIGCSDGDGCTLGDSCSGGTCVSGSAPDCNDSNVCTDDSCTDGSCKHSANAKICDDGNACTTGEHCVSSTCGGASSVVCDDGNPCTNDLCEVASGCKSVISNGSGCSDGNGCTVGDTCSGGSCSGSAKDCSDGNLCTNDGCANGNCTSTANSSACSDGNPCTVSDVCGGGTCAGSAKNCDDGFPCTADSCDGGSGACIHSPSSAGCVDTNPCTDDSCVTGQGCVHIANAATCTDNSACTSGDGCAGGVCKSGSAVVCNDGNACTTDSCTAGSGCVFTNADGTTCSDGDVCTIGDSCQGGVCKPGSLPDCNPGVLAYQRITNTIALDDFRKVTWHPSGAFALILGVSGKVLRYTVSGQALTLETTLGKDVRDLDVQPDGSYFLVLGTNSSNVTQVWKGSVGAANAITWSTDVTVTGTPVAIVSEPGGGSFAIGTYTGTSPYITYLRRWQAGAITLTGAVSTSAGLWDIMWTGAGVLSGIGSSEAVITSQGINGGGSQTWVIDSNTITGNNWGGGFGNAGGAGWRPGGTFGMLCGWTSNIMYIYDGAWKSTYLPGVPNGYNPIAIGWKADGKRALVVGNAPSVASPKALVFEYRAGSASAYSSANWYEQSITGWKDPPWSAPSGYGQLLDIAWRPGTYCDEGLIVSTDFSSNSSSPSYGVLIRFYDVNDSACVP